ncbi:pilin [Patescibacteria group bacterium]|nr:pilin [Patescibacteria group bacterium]MBU1683651.1 pilin [Patescibacteria group bacterium]MBU1935313.1 pilin [Patescibacteria group bacterium]
MVNWLKKISKFFLIAFVGLSLMAWQMPAFAEDTTTGMDFGGVCDKSGQDDDLVYGAYPPCADSPNECGTQEETVGTKKYNNTPLNCLFLEEPIGGEPGYDLYKVTCDITTDVCTYSLWHGEAIVGANERGPLQAILVYEPGKEYQGPFGLLYNYLGVIYNFMSGIIVGFVVLICIVGGIMMTTSAGNQEQFRKGRDMIVKAMIGMVLWFLASLILYTINPTFFAF